jgi:hypothetical protein
MKTIKSILVVIAAVSMAFSPLSANDKSNNLDATPSIQRAVSNMSATESVFFHYGRAKALAEVEIDVYQSSLIDATAIPAYHLPFRTMASINLSTAMIFRSFNENIAFYYFLGRSSVFNQLADLAGEPPLEG